MSPTDSLSISLHLSDILSNKVRKFPYNSIPSFNLITSLFIIIYLIRYNSILLFSHHAFQLMNQNYKHVDSNFIVFPIDMILLHFQGLYSFYKVETLQRYRPVLLIIAKF